MESIHVCEFVLLTTQWSCFSRLSLHPDDSVLYVRLVYYAITFFVAVFH